MSPQATKEILDLLADMKRAAKTPADRTCLDQLAVEVISQEYQPQVMADNLSYWLGLSPAARLAA